MRRAAIAALAFTAVTIESATAHHKGCDGNPVPGDQVGLLRQGRRASTKSRADQPRPER
jgi:hypothetical protein